MSQTSLDFLNLFTKSPGDLIYFLLAIALTQAGLYSWRLGERLRRPQNRPAGRYMIAMLGALAAWVVVMLGALYSVVFSQNISAILPPLERVCSLVIILLIGWAFFTGEDERWSRAANVVLLLLLITALIAYVVTGVQWTNQIMTIRISISASMALHGRSRLLSSASSA